MLGKRLRPLLGLGGLVWLDDASLFGLGCWCGGFWVLIGGHCVAFWGVWVGWSRGWVSVFVGFAGFLFGVIVCATLDFLRLQRVDIIYFSV